MTLINNNQGSISEKRMKSRPVLDLVTSESTTTCVSSVQRIDFQAWLLLVEHLSPLVECHRWKKKGPHFNKTDDLLVASSLSSMC